MSNYHRKQRKVNCKMGQYPVAFPSLTLVGTVHRDPKGFARLSRLLEKERPAFITVEISPYSRTFRLRQASLLRAALRENLLRIQREDKRPLRAILANSLILEIFFLLQQPFEWRTAESYAGRHGVFLRGIDLSPFARKHLAHLSELIGLKNLRTLLHLETPPFTEKIQSQYCRANSLFHHPPSIRFLPNALREREVYMAGQIRQLAQGINGGNILHVGGWEHLIDFPEGDSLFSLLKDLQPHRILLSAFDN